MYKVMVVTDSESADGFRLAGVDVIGLTADDDQSAVISELLNDDSIGVLAVNQSFVDHLDERLRVRLEQSNRPVAVFIPAGRQEVGGAQKREYVARLIRRAIGFDIKLRRDAT